MESIIGAILGSAITAAAAFYIHYSGKPKRSGMAYKVLRSIEIKLETPEGEYCRTKSADDNYEIAQHLYKTVTGEIISTAFHEDPANYGEKDLIRLFRQKDFTRLTCEEVCNKTSQDIARKYLSNLHKGASLIVIPQGAKYVRVDGIFCKFRDLTYLCFLAFHNPSNPTVNRGIVFREDIAESLFDYYKDLSRSYH